MMEFLLSLKARGVSIIVITHDMHLMLEYAERSIVIVDGAVKADDRPADVLAHADIVEAANLTDTSVYSLAVRAGIGQPREFVHRFIQQDRRERAR